MVTTDRLTTAQNHKNTPLHKTHETANIKLRFETQHLMVFIFKSRIETQHPVVFPKTLRLTLNCNSKHNTQSCSQKPYG